MLQSKGILRLEIVRIQQIFLNDKSNNVGDKFLVHCCTKISQSHALEHTRAVAAMESGESPVSCHWKADFASFLTVSSFAFVGETKLSMSMLPEPFWQQCNDTFL